MLCKNCGADIKPEQSKCPVCGEPVPREVNKPDTESVLFSKGYVNPFAPKNDYMGPLPSAGKHKYLAPLIALAIIVLAALIGLLLSVF